MSFFRTQQIVIGVTTQPVTSPHRTSQLPCNREFKYPKARENEKGDHGLPVFPKLVIDVDSVAVKADHKKERTEARLGFWVIFGSTLLVNLQMSHFRLA